MKVRGVMVAMAMFITACAPALPSPSATTVPSSTPPPSSPSEAPSPSTAIPSPTSAGWTEAFRMEGAVLHDLVAGPSGLIAVGCERDAGGNCVRGLLLASADGVAWARVDLADAANTDIWSVHEAGGRWFALGWEINDARQEVLGAVWTSLDGQAWTRTRAASLRSRVVQDVIESSTGIIATGIQAPYASEGGGFIVWDVDTDGSFGKARNIELNGQLSYVDGVAWTGDQFLGWGLGGGLGEEVRSAVLLASADGVSWDVMPDIAAFHAGGIRQLVAVGDRLVAVGFRGSLTSTSPAAWTMGGDGAWTAADVPAGEGIMEAISVEGSMLIARGTGSGIETDLPVSWASSDGSTWTRLPDDEDLPAVPGFKALNRATVPGRTCAGGTLYQDPTPPTAAIFCR